MTRTQKPIDKEFPPCYRLDLIQKERQGGPSIPLGVNFIIGIQEFTEVNGSYSEKTLIKEVDVKEVVRATLFLPEERVPDLTKVGGFAAPTDTDNGQSLSGQH